jgi:tRNA (mo5U34)-methyltransferase
MVQVSRPCTRRSGSASTTRRRDGARIVRRLGAVSSLRWSWRGFGAAVEVPERVTARAGKLLRRRPNGSGAPTPASRLIVRRAPELRVEQHEPAEAIEFFTVLEQHPPAGSNTATTIDGAADDDLAREVAARVWYHTIELPGGIVTPGVYDHRELVPHYGIPDDLRGRSVLDVGPADGFWSLEFERRGADVTAVDVAGASDVDLPSTASTLAREHCSQWSPGDGFDLARRARGSKIKVRSARVYELDPETHGRFDLVHMGDLLLHLRDPVLALQRLRSVTAGEALLSDCYDPTLDGEARLSRYLGGWSWATWSIPSLTTLAQMVADAGFSTVEPVITYRLDQRDGSPGYWRAVLRARV